METDNFTNSQTEIRHKERMLRNSKSRSMTPVTKSTSNNEDHTRPSSTVKQDISSVRHSTGRKVVTSSTKTVSKTKTVSGKGVATVVVVTETNNSPSKPSDAALTRLSSAHSDVMELRSSDRQSTANTAGRRRGTTANRRSNGAGDFVTAATTRTTTDYSSDEEDEFIVVDDDSRPTREGAQGRRFRDAYHGDYWNKLPKTDYTYSPVSNDHHKEVAPGVSMKPNMSRGTYQSSTWSDGTTYHHATASPPRTLTTSSTTTSTIRRSRFFDANKAGTRVPAYINDYAAVDSDDDEVDARVRSEFASQRSPSFFSYFVSWFVAMWTTVWTTTVETVTTRRDQGVSGAAGYSTPPLRTDSSRGWWARALDTVYFLPAYICSIDLGLLSSSDYEERPKRLRLFAGLLLLLLLLLSGWWALYYLEDNGSTLLGDTWAATRSWATALGQRYCKFDGWIFLPFATRWTQQQMEWTRTKDHVGMMPPATTPPPASIPAPTSVDVQALVDAVLASDRFRHQLQVLLLQGGGGKGDSVEDVLASPSFIEWISSRVEEEAKVTGRASAELLLSSATDGLRLELDDKNRLLEDQQARLADEMVRFREEMQKKLNATIAEMKKEQATHAQEIRQLKIQLERCCDKTLPAIPWQDIESHVLRYVAGIYGVAGQETTDRAQLRSVLGNLFVERRQFEAAMANVSARHRAEMLEVSERSAQTVMEAVSEELASHRQRLHVTGGGTGGGLTDAVVMEIVNRAITTYDADKTGMVDFALESSGGSVISTRCTESYYKHSASMTLFGIPYWYPVNTPRTVIQPGVHPGECWAFRGSQGFLVVQLAGLVRISSFSVEHIPRSLAFNGNIDSAPRDFSVWGLDTENDSEPTELGNYTYLKNSTSLQYFLVAHTDVQPFRIVELRIDSNHGNLEYTCLYRFRVHGTWVSY